MTKKSVDPIVSWTNKIVDSIGLSGDYIAWHDSTGYDSIYSYQISTQTAKRLSTDDSFQFQPRIDDGRVVWTDLRASETQDPLGYPVTMDIYMYDTASGEETRITSGDWIQMAPDISGHRIVWQDHRSADNPKSQYDMSGRDIWMYDLETGQEHQITSSPDTEEVPLISGDIVVYARFVPEKGGNLLFMQDLTALGL